MAEKLIGKLYTTAAGFLSYEFYEAEPNYIYELERVLTDLLKFETFTRPSYGLDLHSWDFCKNDIRVTIGWDNWSGCFIMSHCKKGDEYILGLVNYFEVT